MNLKRTIGVDRAEVSGAHFQLIHNDCVAELIEWPDNHVDGIITSIPFGTQYEYCPSFNDFGHNPDNTGFWLQMDFLIPELLRVLKPGRIAAIHVKDRIRFGNVTGFGFPTVEPFSDHCAAAFMKHGFHLMARITIDTDVVRENNQTYRLGWSENAKDGTKMGAGLPEYVMVFRKAPTDCSNGYADVPVPKLKGDERVCVNCRRMVRKGKRDEAPVTECPDCGGAAIEALHDEILGPHCYTRADWQLDAAGLWRSSGDRLLDPDILQHLPLKQIKRLWIAHQQQGGYDHGTHVEIARLLEAKGKLPADFMLFPPVSRHPDVWTDIVRMRTLNTQQSAAQQEKHVCPLQLDIIERLLTRYTSEWETVLDPFMGIGSVAYQALRMKRRAIGCELNQEYWRYSIGYAEAAESDLAVPTLFDLMKDEMPTEDTEEHGGRA